jgi:Zn-dependent protease/CBS domain-containing protein
MGWSLKLVTVAGIRVQIHFTFLIFMAWIVLRGVFQGQSADVTIGNTAFMLGLFGCVVLHEFGHALTAQRYGIRTKDITLLPIGGVARLERMPDDPRQELWVAIAGPAVNVVIAALLYAWFYVSRGGVDLSGQNIIVSGSLLEKLLLVNITLVVFNLLPAFPMDGGRVLRALLAMRMDYTRATQMAASLGQGIALIFGLIGFLYNPFLMFIALFVWIGAAQEASMVQMKSALAGIPVSAAMITDFQTLGPEDSLQQAIKLILAGSQQDFPVVDGGSVVGVLTRDALLRSLARGDGALVSEVMDRDIRIADEAEMLQSALQRLQECACRTLPIVRDHQLVGILTAENMGEFLMIQAALERGRRIRVPA